MISFQPQRIPGRWRDGYALDLHTTSSTFLGNDEFGHPRFDTQRSPAGELLNRLKYHGDATAAVELIEAAVSWLRSWNPVVDILVPVPASRVRTVQPVLVLGEAIANELGVEFSPAAVRRTRETPQLKDVFDYGERSRLLDGLHEVDREKVKGRRVLLFDDLFRSGATMNSIAGVMHDSGQAAEVFAMTVTRTRSHQ